MNASIVGAMKLAVDFRVFLRNNFYPNNQQIMQDNLYSSIQGIDDIDYISDSLIYRLKCKTKKSTNCDMNGYNIEEAIVSTLNKGNIINTISTNSTLSLDEKSSFISVYDQIMKQIHFCGYLKTLYNIIWFPYTATTFMMELYL